MELEVLRKDMVAAMKAKDKVTKEAVSSLIAAVKKVAIDEGCRDDIKGDLVDRVILKELKTAKEQIDTCPADRTDLKEEYQARYDIIAKYAPKQMDEAEIKEVVASVLAEMGLVAYLQTAGSGFRIACVSCVSVFPPHESDAYSFLSAVLAWAVLLVPVQDR